jgi:hypothetical protein
MSHEIEPERLRYVAGHYRELQGLILVPFGLIFLVPGLVSGGWGAQGEMWRWPTIVGALLLSWLASLYYQRAVGRVWPAIQSGGSYGWLMFMIGAALALGWFAGPWFDALLQPPISVTALTVSGVLLVPYVAARGRYRKHYLYLALLYLAIALLPLTGQVSSEQLVTNAQLFGLLYGLPWIVAGLGDHLFLMRSLKPLPREAVDESV